MLIVGYPVTRVLAPPTSTEVTARLKLGKEWMRNFSNFTVRKNTNPPHDRGSCATLNQIAHVSASRDRLTLGSE
jgi:hypothetical protein